MANDSYSRSRKKIFFLCDVAICAMPSKSKKERQLDMCVALLLLDELLNLINFIVLILDFTVRFWI